MTLGNVRELGALRCLDYKVDEAHDEKGRRPQPLRSAQRALLSPFVAPEGKFFIPGHENGI